MKAITVTYRVGMVDPRVLYRQCDWRNMITQSVVNTRGNRFHCKPTDSVYTTSNSCYTTEGHWTKILLRNTVPSAAFELTGMEEEGRYQANFITVLTCMSQLNLLFQHLYMKDTNNTSLNLILPRSRTGTVWFYTSTSNKRAARPKLYKKS